MTTCLIGKPHQVEKATSLRAEQPSVGNGHFFCLRGHPKISKSQIKGRSFSEHFSESTRLSAQLLNTTFQQTELQCESDMVKLRDWAQKFEVYAAKQVWVVETSHVHPTFFNSGWTSFKERRINIYLWTHSIPFPLKGRVGLEAHQRSLPQGSHIGWGVHEQEASGDTGVIAGSGACSTCSATGQKWEHWVSQLTLYIVFSDINQNERIHHHSK